MYKYKKAKRHHFNKEDCCRVIKLRIGTELNKIIGNRARLNQNHNENSNVNGITNNQDYNRKNSQRVQSYAPLRNKNFKPYNENQVNYTPSKDETFGNGFGQSTKVFVMGDSSNKSKSFKFELDQDKENSASQTKQYQQTQQQQITDTNQAIPQIMQMLFEIKNQNLYLIERNLELEQVINSEIRPTIEDGFYLLRNEIRDLKRTTASYRNNQEQQFKKSYKFTRQTTTKRTQVVQNSNNNNYNQPKRYQQTQQLNYVTNEVIKMDGTQEQQLQVPQAATVNVQNLQLVSGAESTFMRKLEETVQIDKQIAVNEEDSMRFSVGAGLLELMALGNKNNSNDNNKKEVQKSQEKKQRGRRVRNFNFRCNLNEIDKIIEEDINETNPTYECSNYVYSNGASPMNKMEQINQEIRLIEETEQMEQTMPLNLEDKYQSEDKRNNSNSKENSSGRPQTSALRNDNLRQQRKAWGPAAASNNRPKTGANAPLRIGKGMISRVGGSSGTGQNDNILALLSQESEEQSQTECKTEVIENPNKLSNGSAPNDQQLKIEDLKDNQQTVKALLNRPALPRKRGMFKPPPSNLLEQLLQDESNNSNQDNNSADKLQTPDKKQEESKLIDNKVKVNNFMTEQQTQKSRSRSRSKNLMFNPSSGNNTKKIIFNKPSGQNAKLNLKFFDSDDDDAQNPQKTKRIDDDDNPFQSTGTLMSLQNQIDSQKQNNKSKHSSPTFNTNIAASSNNDNDHSNISNQNEFNSTPNPTVIVNGVNITNQIRNKRQQQQQQFAKNNVKSIEELLRGEIQQDQDQDGQDDSQFTQTEKQGVFFVHHGQVKNDSSDNTGEFGAV